MTEEERQRLQAELLRKQQAQIAMLSQSAMSPEQLAQLTEQSGYDPAGKEAMLATMLRGGQDAVFGDMPQGKQIGDIYVAPTWSESLNAAVSKGLGGYQMGQARKEQTAIDEKRGLAKTAAAQIAAEEARVKQLADAESGMTSMLNAQGDDARAERQITQQAENARLSREAADNRLSRTMAQQQTLQDQRLKAQAEQAQAAADAKAAKEAEGPKDEPLSPASAAAGIREYRNRIMQDVLPMAQALQRFDTALSPYAVGGEKERAFGDIPGMGVLSGKGGMTGYVGRMGEKVAALAGGEDGATDPEQIFAVARDIANTKVREGAGLSQTVAEIARMKAVLDGEFGSDPAVVRNSVDAVKAAMNADIHALRAGTHPQVVEMYDRQAGDNNITTKQFQRLQFAGDEPEAAAEAAPAGVDAETWQHMTEEERALFR